jgi:hypothetical protein
MYREHQPSSTPLPMVSVSFGIRAGGWPRVMEPPVGAFRGDRRVQTPPIVGRREDPVGPGHELPQAFASL